MLIEDSAQTHMPFLVPVSQDEPVLLLCRRGSTDQKWKLHYADSSGQYHRLETGLPDDATECSPTAWHDDRGWHVTFIAGGWSEDRLFRLYRMDGQSLDSISQPVAIHAGTRAGFVLQDRMVFAAKQDHIHIVEPAGSKTIELGGANIYRVSYRPDQPDCLLISGGWNTDNPDGIFVLQYDLSTGDQHFIECDGKPAYKCALLGDRVIYAERIGKDFEDRRLRQASQVVRRPAKVALLRVDNQPAHQPAGCGCGGRNTPSATPESITRPSCLDCVTKHLGAAYVLLTESREGYAHRLRAIGHLFEAEDESQEWSELHDAIREARRAYQTDGTIPDWLAVGQVVEAVYEAVR